MARVAYYMQFPNSAYSIATGTGDGSTSSVPAAGTPSNFVTALNAGKDVYVNRGGMCTLAQAGFSNDSTSNTWFSLTAAPTNLGRVFSWDGLSGSGVGKDPFTIDPGYYDAPVTSGQGGWTSISAGRWTKNFSFAADPSLRVIFGQAVFGIGLDTTTRLELRQRKTAAACTAMGDWHQTGTTTVTITMYTGGSADADSPSRIMGGLVLAGDQVRWSRALRLDGAKRLEFVDPIQILHGTLRGLSTGAGTRTEDILFNDLKVWGTASNGVQLEAQSSPTAHVGGIFRVRFVRPVISTGTRAEASQADSGEMTNNWHSVQHNIRLWGQVGEISFVNPTLFGARHAGLEVQMTTAQGVNGYPRNIEVYGTSPGGGTIGFPLNDPYGYYRAFGCATDGGVSFRNITITGQSIQSQTNGIIDISNCHWKDFNYSMVSGGPDDDNGGYDNGLALGMILDPGTAALVLNQRKATVTNCIFENCWNYPLIIDISWSDQPAENSVIVSNCLFIDTEHFTERKQGEQSVAGNNRSAFASAASASIRIQQQSADFVTPGARVTPQLVRDCVFITPSSSVIAWSSGGYAHAGTAVSGDTVADGTDSASEIVRIGGKHYTSLSAAGLSATYVPDLTSGVVGAASSTTPRLDFSGKVRAIPGSVGAKEPA